MMEIMSSKSKIVGSCVVASGIIGAFFIYRAYRYVREFRNRFKEIGLKELPCGGWFGGFRLYYEATDLFELEERLVAEHGKVFGYFEGRYPVIMMADPEMAKQVMVKNHSQFMDRRVFLPGRDGCIYVTLDNLTGDRWKHVRQQLTPVFTPANLRRMEPLVIKVAKQLTENIQDMANEGKIIDIKEYCGFFSLDAVASVAFAMDINSFKNQDNPFVAKAKKVFDDFPPNGNFMALLYLFPDYLLYILKAIPLLSMFAKIFAFFENVIAAEISRRKLHESNITRKDLLSQLIPLEKDVTDPANQDYIRIDDLGGKWLTNGLTREEIHAQAILFFLAGYETTASTLSMCLLALSQNQDVQDKLCEELKSVEITWEEVNKIEYLDMVINETLRYYTPVIRTERICTEDAEINGLQIPKGTVIVLPINAIHHDPDYWNEPKEFKPERFSWENSESFPKDSFIPFGTGNRNCIGMRLALMELKLALSMLISRLKFDVAPETTQPIQWDSSFFRKPHSPIFLRATSR